MGLLAVCSLNWKRRECSFATAVNKYSFRYCMLIGFSSLCELSRSRLLLFYVIVILLQHSISESYS